jgi:hypothetical protein
MKLLTLYDRCELRRVFKRNALKLAAPALLNYFRNSKRFRATERVSVIIARICNRDISSKFKFHANNKALQGRLVMALPLLDNGR